MLFKKIKKTKPIKIKHLKQNFLFYGFLGNSIKKYMPNNKNVSYANKTGGQS